VNANRCEKHKNYKKVREENEEVAQELKKGCGNFPCWLLLLLLVFPILRKLWRYQKKHNVLKSSRGETKPTINMDTVAIKTSLPHAPLAGQQQLLLQQQPQQATTAAATTTTNAQTSAINAKNNIGAFFQTCKVRNQKKEF